MARTDLGMTRPGAKVLAILAAVLAAVLLLLVLGAASQLRGFQLAMASQRLGRPVRVDGELSLTPGLGGLTVRFTKLHVDQPAWAGPGDMLAIDRGRLQLPWSVLLGDGRLDDVELDGVRLALRRDALGRANWSGGDGGRPPRAPSLGRLVVRGGVLDLQDAQRALSFHGAVEASVDPAASVLTAQGGGLVGGQAWTLHLVSSQKVFGSSRYTLAVQTGLDGPEANSAVRFDGDLSLARRAELTGELSGSGPDLHALAALTNLPLPRTPPYQLVTAIDATARRVELSQMAGRIGASDVAGRMTITPMAGGRRLDADLSSRSLRISDLFAVASGGELTQPSKRPGQLLPDATINPAPLRKLSGVVRFAAASVQPPTTPTIRSLSLTVRFDRGRVETDPLVLQLTQGQGVVRAGLDLRGALPILRLDADLIHANTGEVFKAAGAPIQASFDAKVRLQGAGGSIAAAAGHASGLIELKALDGRLQPAPADVLSADFVRAVISLLTRSPSSVKLHCAVARFSLADGQAKAEKLRLSTELGRVQGVGGFDLRSNMLDLTMTPMGGLSGPTSVRIAGPLAHPHATLALANPGHVLVGAFKRLTGQGAPASATPGCS